MTEFQRADAEVRALGARLLAIGDAMLHRPDDVSVCQPEGDFPPDSGSDDFLGIEDELPAKEAIRELLVRRYLAKKA